MLYIYAWSRIINILFSEHILYNPYGSVVSGGIQNTSLVNNIKRNMQ